MAVRLLDHTPIVEHRMCPLWADWVGWCWSRAVAPGGWRLRPRPSNQFLRPHQPRPGSQPRHDPRCHQPHSDDGVSTRSATDQMTHEADLATESRSGPGKSCLQPPCDYPEKDDLCARYSTATTAQSGPTAHPSVPAID